MVSGNRFEGHEFASDVNRGNMKRSLSKMRKTGSDSTSVLSGEIRNRVANVQKMLQERRFLEALNESFVLEQETLELQSARSVYLTSLVWKVRALQGMEADKAEIDTAALHYASESERLEDWNRAVQGYRILAQSDIFAGEWDKAIEHLEHALDLGMKGEDGRAVLEILMHIGGLELKLCHYMEAIDAISRAVGALDGAGMPAQEAAEFRAMGQRQLADLYDMVGAGQEACNALEAAQNAKSQDFEELWLQQMHFSRLDLRSGNASAAVEKLESVVTDLITAVSQGKAQPEQCQMAELELLQAQWNLPHAQAECFKALDGLEHDISSEPLRLAVALMRFQWLAEGELDSDALRHAREMFENMCDHQPQADVQIRLAAALTSAALEIRRGHYEATLEPLRHIAETAAFTQLIPFATRALALRSQIYESLCQFSRAAVDAHNACETFIEHVDDVSAKLAAAMMLCAQVEQTRLDHHGIVVLEESEIKAFEQLRNDMKRFELQKHSTAFIDLGLELAKICHVIGDETQKVEILNELQPYLTPEFGARIFKYQGLLG